MDRVNKKESSQSRRNKNKVISKKTERGFLNIFRLLNPMSIGAALIFCSWVTQNYFQAEWTSRREMMERYANLASHEMSRADQYFIMYMNEKKKHNPDPEILRNAGINYLALSMKVIEIHE